MSGKTMFLLKFGHLSEAFSQMLWDKLDKLKICSGQLVTFQFLLEQKESGFRLWKISKK